MSFDSILNRVHEIQECESEKSFGFEGPIPGLYDLLTKYNGFYAYRKGLHVFGCCKSPRWHSLESWNDPRGWISEYGDCSRNLYFFAEDTFGDQFAWDGHQIVRFLAETGEREAFASDIESWLEKIVGNADEELGLTVLRNWIKANGPVPEGKHLFPRTPFVAGGATDPSNIVTIDPFENMKFKGYLAGQIANLPDGAQIELIVEPPLED